MATRVIMPKQGLQMTEGTVLQWFFKEGDKVEADKPLFEIETDKLSIEIDSPASGTLLKIIKEEGEVVPIAELIAVIGEEGEDISEILKEAAPAEAEAEPEQAPEAAKEEVAAAAESAPAAAVRAEGERIFISPRAKALAEDKGINYDSIAGTGPEGMIIERDIVSYAASQPKTTPLAKKAADKAGIDVTDVDGSGARGKVMVADIQAAIAARAAAAGGAARGETIVPFTGMRKVISERMSESLHTMAQANHRMSVDMTEAIRFRETLKANDIKVSYNDILVKVISKALKEFPMMNSSLTADGLVLKDYVNMGMAVALDNGLIVPNIKNADLMTLEEISAVSADLISKAKSGKLTPDDYKGGTFTISNLGMFGVDHFTAIVNPPEVGILAIGTIEKKPVVVGDEIVIKPITVLSLSYDHRVVDGAPAAQFLQRIKILLENPYLLI
ncbi:MAG: dihydrolipoamide acetyltransferase family protein [Christensenellales bacterium]|jgi:pyruvate dehydrogenase E2 component (dihydrolipoamide acetyltransferase)